MFQRLSNEFRTRLERAIKADDVLYKVSKDSPSDELVIFLHGFASDTIDYLGLLEFFYLSGKDVFAVNFDASAFSKRDPNVLVDEILAKIKDKISGRGRVLLCGHSMGCVLLKAAINAWKPANAGLQGRVRLLLLSCTNRGFRAGTFKSWLALQMVHRWFWFGLLIISAGWWIASATPILAKVFFALAVAGVIASGVYSRSYKASLIMTLTWAVWLVVWPAWGAFQLSWLLVTAIVLTPIVAGCTAWKFNYTCRAVTGTTLGALAVAVCPSLPSLCTTPLWQQWLNTITIAPDCRWMWPATLAMAFFAVLAAWPTGLLMENFLFGAAWIARVRLDWIEANLDLPTTYLFGDNDEFVEDDDQTLGAHGAAFAIKDCNHQSFRLTAREFFDPRTMRIESNQKDATYHNRIRAILGRYIALGTDAIVTIEILGDGNELRATSSPTVVNEPIDVVFLIHGIRDFGEWEDTLAVQIKKSAGNRPIEIVIIRYGYFNAFQFLLWGERERSTQLFLDAYVQARSRYPNGRLHAVAHSNGTFIVTNALKRDCGIKLVNAYLAGSVVYRFFGWPQLPKDSFARLHYDRATQDWPVGALCWWLSLDNQVPGMLLGTGGVDGFTNINPSHDEREFVSGGHGEAIRAKYHGEIADFVLNGVYPRKTKDDPKSVDHVYLWLRRVLTLVGAVLVAGAYCFTVYIGGNSLWSVSVGAFLTLIIIRIMMAI